VRGREERILDSVNSVFAVATVFFAGGAGAVPNRTSVFFMERIR
jgi:hypothetical protein